MTDSALHKHQAARAKRAVYFSTHCFGLSMCSYFNHIGLSKGLSVFDTLTQANVHKLNHGHRGRAQ